MTNCCFNFYLFETWGKINLHTFKHSVAFVGISIWSLKLLMCGIILHSAEYNMSIVCQSLFHCLAYCDRIFVDIPFCIETNRDF